MTYRCFYTPLGYLALLAWPLASAAQTQAAPTLALPPITFKSAFEGYQPFTDDPAGRWREANDTTARIGGWRAYAKEAAGAAPEKPVPPAPALLPGTPPAPAPESSPKAAAVKP